MFYEFSILADIVLSLTLIVISLILFIRLVHDYRLVYTVGNICKKVYRVEYRPSIVIPLNLYICKNVDLISAESPQAELVRIVDDSVELQGVYPDIYRGEVDLYIKARVHGLLDSYDLKRRIRLELR